MRSGRIEQFFGKPGQGARQKLIEAQDLAAAARAMNAMGHPQRVALLQAMLTGAGSHAELRERTGLKAGPMYHHLRELRLAGFLEDGPRDVYRLTRRAQDLFWVVLAVLAQSG